MHYPVPPTAAQIGGPPHLMGNIVGFHGRMARKLAESRLVSSGHIMIGDYIIRESTNTPPVSALQGAIMCLQHIMHSLTHTYVHMYALYMPLHRCIVHTSPRSDAKVCNDTVHHWE